jgi:hypothetical protein
VEGDLPFQRQIQTETRAVERFGEGSRCRVSRARLGRGAGQMSRGGSIPAGCAANCERELYTEPICREHFRAALACYQSLHSPAIRIIRSKSSARLGPARARMPGTAREDYGTPAALEANFFIDGNPSGSAQIPNGALCRTTAPLVIGRGFGTWLEA